MADQTPRMPPVPESRAVPRTKTRLSLVWIIPIVAALAGAWVAVARVMSEGPKITIVLRSADGIEAGKTKLQYNGVQVGTVTNIRLADDHASVIATAQMVPKAESFLLEDTRLWVVRPRVTGATVTGLGTLISGAYIGMEIGESKTGKRDFVALETPPVVAADVPGRYFVLTTPDLGSLADGTPIFFRRIQVGEVSSYDLDDDGKSLSVKIFVKAPYDQYVTANTRFWNASGIDLSLSAAGLSVQSQSVLSILVGGIAFETPADGAALPPAAVDAVFPLFSDRKAAFKLPSRDPQTYVLVFKQSVRGLNVGAPVDFRGIAVGEVVGISAHLDTKTFDFSVPVTIRLDFERLGIEAEAEAEAEAGAANAAGNVAAVRRKMVESMVSRGVRGQLQTGSLLTGALYVALDFFPDAAPATLDWSQNPVELPTMPGEIQAIEASVVNIIKKLDQLPFEKIAADLQNTIVDLDRTLVSARSTLDDAGKLIAPNSVLSTQLDNMLMEMTRAARGLRVLADYLERHPEALIRGKTGEAQ